MINSSHTLVIALAIIVLGGYSKVLLAALPYETMVTAVVSLTTVYLTKRIVQKMPVFKNTEQEK